MSARQARQAARRRTDGITRRGFLRLGGAGLLVTLTGPRALAAQEAVDGAVAGRAGVLARLLIGADGGVTVFTGKVEVGQGARTQLAMAVAEELAVALERVALVMGDTAVVPDDGGTYGSLTTPRTVPTVRRGAAAARRVLLELGARRLGVPVATVVARDGAVEHAEGGRRVSYADLARGAELEAALARSPADDVEVERVADWQVLGHAHPRVLGHQIVTGAHRYPSDQRRPGMLHGVVLRPPSYGARLLDLGTVIPATAATHVVRDGDLVGVLATTSLDARRTRDALARTARWEERDDEAASDDLERVLRARAGGAGSGFERRREWTEGSPAETFAAAEEAGRVRRATYTVAYIQHVPLEPRAALAEWEGGRLTVWTGTQVPFGVRRELAEHFGLANEAVRVVVPDTGGAFGGKHTGECAVEAARLARAAGRPVLLRWSREEEMTWAYFRPAGVLDLAAALDGGGRVAAWEHVNLNSGASALRSPYAIPHRAERYLPCDAPLRQGSYRALAATANSFAREGFLDELAVEQGADPLRFRLDHLAGDGDRERLRTVLQAAAERFSWERRRARPRPQGRGIGIACGVEKGSVVAACVEVATDPEERRIEVLGAVQAFECGAIHNPDNLRAQNEGSLVMALGGALREEVRFAGGRLLAPRLSAYPVPRFSDVPEIESVLVDRPELPSVGAGETPMIAVAPAIAAAVFDAAGVRLRALPLEGAWRASRGIG
ncbi:MAG TPA: molybdopterin cofactor-binding domain-containing protein [Thermoanaerobaculia bacterium]|nr:molybdopterin cofactor-binding domain-containing protein [Thermoanaerobaculia bacterium]